ncbi:hypothetical protein [Rhizobium sp. SSA_523]|uniref:hypothetical protein n=1 Tax=Rhizobium sp. SSA_523 TaxID=2952477 RepID=UPI0020913D76|nr:hypothetical protein [Rhizobium sp. SSA_523]MCO5733823.1 hypothetical protein [Rhizobium sp. SSA_523]WKC24905.1 hypothetical protein QTJ18_12915 [Rhizobium sp. SSA_523]
MVLPAQPAGDALEAALRSALAQGLAWFWLKGLKTAAQVQAADVCMRVVEAQAGLPQDHLKLLISPCDTACGSLDLMRICRASPRLVAVIWDAAASRAALASPAGDSRPLQSGPIPATGLARDMALIAAAAAGLPIYEAPDEPSLPDASEAETLRFAQACTAAREAGLHGKLAIHPWQARLTTEIFGVEKAEVDG